MASDAVSRWVVSELSCIELADVGRLAGCIKLPPTPGSATPPLTGTGTWILLHSLSSGVES